MRVARAARVIAAVVLCSLLTLLGVAPGAGLRAGKATQTYPTPQAAAFLATYVRADGRVARPDQGNDTVSEGQAYGLLIAQTMGNERLFRRIWQWTRRHLQRDDGLFAWRAGANGQVWGWAPASDADVLIAWALLRYRGAGAEGLHTEGRRVAEAVLSQEVTTTSDGLPVLTAGPWATGRPATLDPSYWSLPAFTELARLTGDRTWRRLADSAVVLTGRLTRGGRRLPPDWATLGDSGQLLPSTAPDYSQPQPRYGLDAQRTVVWFAASCDPRAVALARQWWQLLDRPSRPAAMALQLDGRVLNPTPAVLPLVAAAAAAHAADAPVNSALLLRRAADQDRRHPGYYGSAWNAFGPALLDSRVLSGC